MASSRPKLTPWQCSKCGTQNSRVKAVCGMCGSLRPKRAAGASGGADDAAGRSELPKPPKSMQMKIPGVCRKCHADLEDEIHPPGFCFHCNHRQPSQEEREALWNDPPEVPCSKCEEDVKGLKFCNSCGTKVLPLKELFAVAKERILKHRAAFMQHQSQEDYSRFAQDGGLEEVLLVEKEVCGACNQEVQPGDLQCGNCNAKLQLEVSRTIKGEGVEALEAELRDQGKAPEILTEEEARIRLERSSSSPSAAAPASSSVAVGSSNAGAVQKTSQEKQKQSEAASKQESSKELFEKFRRLELKAQDQQQKPKNTRPGGQQSGEPKPGGEEKKEVGGSGEEEEKPKKRIVVRRVVRRVMRRKKDGTTEVISESPVERKEGSAENGGDGRKKIIRRVVKRKVVKKASQPDIDGKE